MTDPIDIRSRLPRTGPHSVSRIDTLDLQSPVRIVPGSFEQRQCAPGVCQGLPTCSDAHCEGHPHNAVRDDERDPRAVRWFLVGYSLFMGACLLAIVFAEPLYQWLSR